ncbi:MAG: hypothetical protein ACREUG_12620, partial [Steroidobacteraceae bacterium]
MTNLNISKKHWVGLALCAGLMTVPLAALADASGEISTAAQHAQYSAQATSLKVAHAHLHHALNCLVGPKGHGFDKKAADPCMGQGDGAIPDTTDAATKKSLEHIAAQTRAALR